jgi:hypothetical protein
LFATGNRETSKSEEIAVKRELSAGGLFYSDQSDQRVSQQSQVQLSDSDRDTLMMAFLRKITPSKDEDRVAEMRGFYWNLYINTCKRNPATFFNDSYFAEPNKARDIMISRAEKATGAAQVALPASTHVMTMHSGSAPAPAPASRRKEAFCCHCGNKAHATPCNFLIQGHPDVNTDAKVPWIRSAKGKIWFGLSKDKPKNDKGQTIFKGGLKWSFRLNAQMTNLIPYVHPGHMPSTIGSTCKLHMLMNTITDNDFTSDYDVYREGSNQRAPGFS